MNSSDLSSFLVELLEHRRAGDFAREASKIAVDVLYAEQAKRGLLDIAKAENACQEIRKRTMAIDALGLLGFAKLEEVRFELFEIFREYFDQRKLEELTDFAASPKKKRRGAARSELLLLASLVRALLRVPGEPGLCAANQVAKMFSGTKFGEIIVQRIAESQGFGLT